MDKFSPFLVLLCSRYADRNNTRQKQNKRGKKYFLKLLLLLRKEFRNFGRSFGENFWEKISHFGCKNIRNEKKSSVKKQRQVADG